jgi:hypothetical protein
MPAARPLELAEGADSADSGAAGVLAELAEAAERVRDDTGRSKSAATIKAYAAGCRDFLAFCDQRGASALPASDQTVAAYLAALADRDARATTARFSRGPVFRSLDIFDRVQPERLSDRAVARILKRRAKSVGLDPARYAGTRSGRGWPRVQPRRGHRSG